MRDVGGSEPNGEVGGECGCVGCESRADRFWRFCATGFGGDLLSTTLLGVTGRSYFACGNLWRPGAE